MLGKIKYVGESRYQQIQCGERVIVFETGGPFKEVPIFKCKELIGKGEFIPDQETFNNIKTIGQKDPAIEIENRWFGERCFIIGSGTSLNGFDYSILDNENTLILNHMVRVYPRASSLLFMDFDLIKKSGEYVKKFEGLIFAAYRTLYQDHDNRKNVHYFSTNKTKPQSKYIHGLYNSILSGLAAINLCLLMGVSEIYLLGYDLDHENKNPYGYDNPMNSGKGYKEKEWCDERIKMFDKYKPFTDRVFNCNSNSGIKIFKYKNIKEILK